MKFLLSTLLFFNCSKAMHIEEESPSLSNLKAKIESALDELTVPQSSQVLEAGLSQDLWGKILSEYCDDASVQKVNRVSRTLYTVYLNQRKQGIEKIIDILENIKLSDWVSPLTFLPTECSIDDNGDYIIKELPFNENDPSVQQQVAQKQQKLETIFDIDKADTSAFFETITRYPHRLLYLSRKELTPHVIGAHILTRIYTDYAHPALDRMNYFPALQKTVLSKFEANVCIEPINYNEFDNLPELECLGFGINPQVKCSVFPFLSVQKNSIRTIGWNIKYMKNLQPSQDLCSLDAECLQTLETFPLKGKPQIKSLSIQNFSPTEITKIPDLGFSSLTDLQLGKVTVSEEVLDSIILNIPSLQKLSLSRSNVVKKDMTSVYYDYELFLDKEGDENH